MIVLFVSAHLILVAPSIEVINSICIFAAIYLFFFKMRLYDEIKDYELDCEINPDRPLPRGLLTISDVKKGIISCIILEIALFIPLGTIPLIAIVVAIAYSLLMYKEFFIGKLIRPHLTTYALLHTIVTVPMGLAIFVGSTGLSYDNLSRDNWYFVFSSWFVFNIFEFGRKTFTSNEERNAVESYSKIFTRFGAVLLVNVMSFSALYMLFHIQESVSIAQSILTLTLFIIGVIFSISDKEKFGKIYRLYSSIYIILFYIIFIIEIKTGFLL